MNENTYRWLVVSLLSLLCSMTAVSFGSREKQVVEKIRGAFDLEEAVKEHYKNGFRLVAIEQLANDGNPSTHNKTEYVLFFEK